MNVATPPPTYRLLNVKDGPASTLPSATTAAYFCTPTAIATWGDRLQVNLELITRRLTLAGMPQQHLESLAILLWHPADFDNHPYGSPPAGLGAWYEESINLESVGRQDGNRAYQVVVNVVITPTHMRKANSLMWHELYHPLLRLTGRIHPDRVPLYNRSGWSRFFGRLTKQSYALLNLFDFEEWRCDFFSLRQIGRRPISLEV